MNLDFLILGAGLSGLENAYLLSQKGYRVCVLEQNPLPGGCLQPFRRGSHVFDTGFHYVGGLAAGGPLHPLFAELNLLSLPWLPLDAQGFDRVYWDDGTSLAYPQGYEAFTERVLKNLPQASAQTVAGVRAYVRCLQGVNEALTLRLTERQTSVDPAVGPHVGIQKKWDTAELFATGAYRYLQENVQDARAVELLTGNAFTLELHPQRLPLYALAQISGAFLHSAHRLRGGAQVLIQRLLQGIEAYGGVVRCGLPVTRLIERGGRWVGAEAGGERFEARQCISTLHPARTFDLLQDSDSVVKALTRRRIAKQPNTYGMFTLHLGLQAERLPYFNHNIYLHHRGRLWQQAVPPCPPEERSLMICCQPPADLASAYTREVSILMPMYWEEVAPWIGTRPGQRGPAYEEFKARMAQGCLRRAAQVLPNLEAAVESRFSATPLTYLHYTRVPQGSAYGLRKDCDRPLFTVLPSRTPLPNLHLCSQHLSLHGLLGVSVTTHRLQEELFTARRQ